MKYGIESTMEQNGVGILCTGMSNAFMDMSTLIVLSWKCYCMRYFLLGYCTSYKFHEKIYVIDMSKTFENVHRLINHE